MQAKKVQMKVEFAMSICLTLALALYSIKEFDLSICSNPEICEEKDCNHMIYQILQNFGLSCSSKKKKKKNIKNFIKNI